MRTVSSNTPGGYAMFQTQRFRDSMRAMMNGKKPDMETGGTLNEQGSAAFRTRVNELLSENGITGGMASGRVDGAISLSVDANGKHIVTSDHPDKAKIESLLNNDEKLKQIKNDPANAFDWSREARMAPSEQDSAVFSEEARRLYELRANAGEEPYASSVEDTADVMEWASGRKAELKDRLENALANGAEVKNTSEKVYESADPNFDLSKLDALRSEKMDELLKAKSWMETEVASALENAGLDASKLSGIKMAVYDDKLEVAKNQANLSEEERAKIEAILNAPANKELRNVMAQVLQDESRISASLQKVTGLSTTDWEEVLQSTGGNFANVDNDGIKRLLEHDPDLANALTSLFGGTGIVGNSLLQPSAKKEAERSASALGYAIETGIAGAATFYGSLPMK